MVKKRTARLRSCGCPRSPALPHLRNNTVRIGHRNQPRNCFYNMLPPLSAKGYRLRYRSVFSIGSGKKAFALTVSEIYTSSITPSSVICHRKPRCYFAFFLYSCGVTPIRFENTSVKYAGEQKPHSPPISATLFSLRKRSSHAIEIRHLIAYSRRVHPIFLLKIRFR